MSAQQKNIDSIRDFNRYYTNLIGVLNRHYLKSAYSLPEIRVLYEIKHTPDCTARKVRDSLNIDEGYLSRIVDRFVKQGLLKRQRSAEDSRVYFLGFTKKGEQSFARLNEESNHSIHEMIKDLSQKEMKELIGCMHGIRKILTK